MATDERRQLFIRLHNETPSVVAVRGRGFWSVSRNDNCSPAVGESAFDPIFQGSSQKKCNQKKSRYVLTY
jgi:hypothetical protein